MQKNRLYDCVIIGAGPAGLTAATYLARFRCKIKIIDNGNSRAKFIPCSHNFPGFPNGIKGTDLLNLLKKQSEKYGNKIIHDTTLSIKKNKQAIFTIKNLRSSCQAKTVILATGVEDIEPLLPNLVQSIKNGLIRHCIVCDGYEVINQKLAILCNSKKGINQALFLKNYSNNISLFTLGINIRLTASDKKLLKKEKIKMITDPVIDVKCHQNKITSIITKQKTYVFDGIYSALGAVIRSKLAIKLGAKHLKDFSILVDSHQQTSIKNFYAIGDVVAGLNQITVATGQAAVAAVSIFNYLRKKPKE